MTYNHTRQNSKPYQQPICTLKKLPIGKENDPNSVLHDQKGFNPVNAILWQHQITNGSIQSQSMGKLPQYSQIYAGEQFGCNRTNSNYLSFKPANVEGKKRMYLKVQSKAQNHGLRQVEQKFHIRRQISADKKSIDRKSTEKKKKITCTLNEINTPNKAMEPRNSWLKKEQPKPKIQHRQHQQVLIGRQHLRKQWQHKEREFGHFPGKQAPIYQEYTNNVTPTQFSINKINNQNWKSQTNQNIQLNSKPLLRSQTSKNLNQAKCRLTNNKNYKQILQKLREYKFIEEYMSNISLEFLLSQFQCRGEPQCKWVMLVIDHVYQYIRKRQDNKIELRDLVNRH